MMTENFENVNHLVLNFYPDGYSIAVKLNEFPVFTSETILETARISYEETSLLDYIENEELPPLLVEMIDGSPKLSQYKIWHNGCLIIEVRDKIDIVDSRDDSKINDPSYKCITQNISAINGFHNHHHPHHQSRQPQSYSTSNSRLDPQWMTNNCYKNTNFNSGDNSVGNGESSTKSNNSGSYFILLKPTNLSMLNDVLNLTKSNSWSPQDKLQLESQIVLYNSPSLFLEPDATLQPPDQNCHLPGTKIHTNHARHKKKLPHTKLMNKTGLISCGSKANNVNHPGNGSGNNTKSSNYNQQAPPESLPPELILQQFLATKRANKKKAPAAGHHLPRFQRFKKHLPNSNM